MRLPKSRHPAFTPPPQTVALNEMQAASDARLGCERMHERTLNLFARMAFRDGTDLTTAMIKAQHGAAAAVRWAA